MYDQVIENTYFSHRECKHYPCHNINHMGEINCIFCYCPLYHMNCDGDFIILKNGIKDCSHCILPHSLAGYDYVVNKLKENLDNK